MRTVRLNITLPQDVGDILAGVENKSAYIAEAVRDKKKMEEKEKIRKQLAAAYKEAVREDYEVYMEWEDTIEDGLKK